MNRGLDENRSRPRVGPLQLAKIIVSGLFMVGRNKTRQSGGEGAKATPAQIVVGALIGGVVGKKEIFDRLCAEEDQTPSQVVRRLIREYIEHRLGRPWEPGEATRESVRGKTRP